MKVLLSSDWFGPDMRRYRKAHNPHTMDEALRELLPSTAKVIEEEAPASSEPPEPLKPTAPAKIKI
jgi:cytochrome P450